MKVKEMVVKVLAGVVLVTAACAQQATVRAGDEGATVVVTPDRAHWGMQQSLANETPEMKEVRALQIQLEFLRDEQRVIRNAAMKTPEVVAAVEAHRAAVTAFTEKLAANPECKALCEEKDKLDEQIRAIQAEANALQDMQMRQAKYREIGGVYRQIAELNQKITAFPDTVPELAALKKAKQDAAIAFLKVLEDKLGADAEYTRLEEKIKGIQAIVDQAQQGRVNVWSSHAGGQWGNRRPRGGQNEQAPAEPQKNAQVF